MAEFARGLRGKPDCAVRRRKDIMRAGARQDGKGLHDHFGVNRATRHRHGQRCCEAHHKPHHRDLLLESFA